MKGVTGHQRKSSSRNVMHGTSVLHPPSYTATGQRWLS